MKKNSKWNVFLIAFVSAFIVLIWFRDGKFIASGEAGLWLYNAERILSKSGYVWSEFATGLPIPSYVTRIPTLYFFLLLQKYLSPVVSQMVIYYLLITSGMVGMFYLAKEVVGDRKRQLTLLFISLFYFSNLFSMTQIWNRLIYSSMFIWSYLPWFLFLWMKMIKKPKLSWFVLFIISNVFFANAFTVATFVIALWVPAICWLLVEIFYEYRKGNKRTLFRYVYRGLGIMALWVLVNIWWISPYLKIGSNIFVSTFTWKFNFDTLTAVSEHNPVRNILTLYHGVYLGKYGPWGVWFQSIPAFFLALLVFSIFLIGILRTIKIKKYRFLLVLAFVSFFIVKGSNPPFGVIIYQWLFKNIPQAGILRNPYEKFGVVWLLTYSFYFGFGLDFLLAKYKKVRGRVAMTILILTMVVLVWPMWAGDVYPDSLVEVPGYYQDVNEHLRKYGKQGRLLMTPMTSGDASAYDWGYDGVEISDFLIDKSTVSSITSNKYIDEKYNALKGSIEEGQGYHKHLHEMNIRYLILQENLETDEKGLMSIDDLKNLYANDSQIRMLNQFGPLILYEFIDNNLSEIEILSEESIDFSVKRLSSTDYIVQIKKAQKPFVLVLKKTYNDVWIARIDENELVKHLVIYDYANSWEVDKKGDYKINISFKVWPWQ